MKPVVIFARYREILFSKSGTLEKRSFIQTFDFRLDASRL
jgi:hypothetical protein